MAGARKGAQVSIYKETQLAWQRRAKDAEENLRVAKVAVQVLTEEVARLKTCTHCYEPSCWNYNGPSGWDRREQYS